MRYINKTNIPSCLAPVRGVNSFVVPCLLAEQQLATSCIKSSILSLNAIHNGNGTIIFATLNRRYAQDIDVLMKKANI